MGSELECLPTSQGSKQLKSDVATVLLLVRFMHLTVTTPAVAFSATG